MVAEPSLPLLADRAVGGAARGGLHRGEREAVDAAVGLLARAVRSPVRWGHGPVKNVAKTPLVGGQWEHGKKYPYELVIVENALATEVPLQGKVKALE